MSDQPAPTNTELFQLAATLAGCKPIDLVDVSIQQGSILVVGLITGQQFTFNPALLGAEVTDAIRAQLAQVLSQDVQTAPAADAAPTAVGAPSGLGARSGPPPKGKRAA